MKNFKNPLFHLVLIIPPSRRDNSFYRWETGSETPHNGVVAEQGYGRDSGLEMGLGLQQGIQAGH